MLKKVQRIKDILNSFLFSFQLKFYIYKNNENLIYINIQIIPDNK